MHSPEAAATRGERVNPKGKNMETENRKERSLSREEMLACIEKQQPDMGEKLKRLVEKEEFLKAIKVLEKTLEKL